MKALNQLFKQKQNQVLNHENEKGFSNVQIAIGILVGVIILLGALGGYQYVSQAKVNNELSTLGDLKSATVRYGQFAGTFAAANVTLQILNGQNFFSSSGLTNSGTAAAPVINNQWGGTVTAASATANQAGDSIAFTFTAVPGNACRDLGTKVDNLAAAVSIGGTATKAVGAASVPLTVTTQCAAGGDNNTIIYTITK